MSSTDRSLHPSEHAALDEVLLVLVNVPDEATAQRIEAALLDARLAACINRLAPVRSVYVWAGAREVAHELPLLIKTGASVWPTLRQTLLDLHPYDVPEILAWPVSAQPAYAAWVMSSLGPV